MKFLIITLVAFFSFSQSSHAYSFKCNDQDGHQVIDLTGKLNQVRVLQSGALASVDDITTLYHYYLPVTGTVSPSPDSEPVSVDDNLLSLRRGRAVHTETSDAVSLYFDSPSSKYKGTVNGVEVVLNCSFNDGKSLIALNHSPSVVL